MSTPTPRTDKYAGYWATKIYGEKSIFEHAQELERETIELREKLKVAETDLKYARSLNDKAICAFCGHIGPKNAEMIMDHAMTCEKHPMKKFADIIVEAQEAIASSELRVGGLEKALKEVAAFTQPTGMQGGSIVNEIAKAALSSAPTATAKIDAVREAYALLQKIRNPMLSTPRGELCEQLNAVIAKLRSAFPHLDEF